MGVVVRLPTHSPEHLPLAAQNLAQARRYQANYRGRAMPLVSNAIAQLREWIAWAGER